MEEEVDYKLLYEREKKQNEILSLKVTAYEMPGKAKLFYSLNRQQNDLADMMNKVDLRNIDIADKDNKTMERLKMIWASIGTLAPLVDMLQSSAGVTGNEKEDMANRVPFIERIATKREL